MRYLFLVLFLFFLMGKSASASDLNSNVVKIRSKICVGSGQTLKGSGYGFMHGGEFFVVTSEHVVLASNGSEFCHTVAFANGTEVKATVWSLNWWLGTAVMKLGDEAAPRDWPDLSEVVDALNAQDEPNPGDKVIMSGYPYENDLLFVDSGASVLTLAGYRNSIPGIDKTFEVRGVVERGMSGGPLLRLDGTWYGVISHQYLHPVAGGPSYPETFGTDTLTISNHLIVIPLESLVPWITDAVNKTEPEVYALGIRKDPYAQLAGKDIIYLGSTKVTFTPPDPTNLVGGLLPGAGDGVGTGGTRNQDRPVAHSGKITVTHHSDSDSPSELALPTKVDSWLTGLEQVMSRRRKGVIDSIIVDRKPKAIYSLAGFFNELVEDKAFVSVDWSVAGLPKPKASSVSVKSNEILDLFSDALESLDSDEEVAPKDIVAIRSLFETQRDVFRTTNELGRIVYSVDELNQIKENTVGWNWFFAQNFKAAVDLRSHLEELIDIAQNEQL